MRGNILLLTALDETHRQLLLESQGYEITVAPIAEAVRVLAHKKYHLVLATTDDGVDRVLAACASIKQTFPEVKVALVAQRAEYVPAQDCIDAVIRQQHSPGQFLAVVKKLIEAAGGQSLPASTGK